MPLTFGGLSLLSGGDGAVVDRTFAAADVGSCVISLRSIALSNNSHCVELTSGAKEPRVGNKNLLIGRAFHLESARGIADRGDFDEVVALPTGKGDGVASVSVGACAPVHVARERGRSDFCVLQRFALGSDDLAADHVELLGAKRRAESGYDRSNGCYVEYRCNAHDYLDVRHLRKVALDGHPQY